MKLNQFDARLSRRIFLKSLCLTGIAINFPCFSYAILREEKTNAKVLHLFHPETKERLTTTYWIDGNYIHSALSEIDHIMRDRYMEKTRKIDTKLLDLLYNISLELKAREPFHILSGYRCRETNESLRRQGWAVAKKSLHEMGKAADVRFPKIYSSKLRRAAYRLKMGGVGYYPKLNFVHVDVGSLRYWRK